MGLFHDTCTAIVDDATGEALAGEALAAAKALLAGVDSSGRPVHLHGDAAAKALATRGWRFCGAKVSKKARFCRECGTGAPKGYVKCPSCRKWIGNDAHYCPHCNHPLHPEERAGIAGGVWDRDPGTFAQRFECGEDERQLREGVQVQEGTVALLLDGGRQTRVLGPGRHTPDGTLRAINWFGNPPPRSVVLVASGDMVFRVSFPGLRSAEDLPVDATAEATLRFVPDKAADFLANFMKERRTVSADAVCDWLMSEAASAAKDLALQSTIEDLVKDPERRPRFEEALSRALGDLLSRNGLSLVRVGAVEFDGPDYERMRAKYAELDKARRELEFKRANLALIASEDELDKADAKAAEERTCADDRDRASRQAADAEFRAKKTQEVSEYLAQLAQEKDLAGIDRAAEAQLALKVANGTLARKDAELEAAARLERDAREAETLAHKLDLDLRLRDYTRESLLKDAQAAAKVAAVKRDERLAEARTDAEITVLSAEAWAKRTGEFGRGYEEYLKHLAAGWRAFNDTQLEYIMGLVRVKAANEEIKTKAMRERAEMTKGRSYAELAGIYGDDAAARKDFADLERLRIQAGMTQQQILAAQAGASQSAAQAYAQGEASAAYAAAGASDAVNAELKNEQAALRGDLAATRAHDERVVGVTSAVAAKAAERVDPAPPPPTTQQIIK